MFDIDRLYEQGRQAAPSQLGETWRVAMAAAGVAALATHIPEIRDKLQARIEQERHAVEIAALLGCDVGTASAILRDWPGDVDALLYHIKLGDIRFEGGKLVERPLISQMRPADELADALVRATKRPY